MVEVLYFSAPWCSPCRVFGPVLQKASEQRGFAVKKVDAEADMALAQQYDVMSLPTTIWFKDGEAKLAKVGPLTEDGIDKVISHLGA